MDVHALFMLFCSWNAYVKKGQKKDWSFFQSFSTAREKREFCHSDVLFLGVFLRARQDSPGGGVHCEVRAMETRDQDVGWAWPQLDRLSRCSGIWNRACVEAGGSDGKTIEKKNDIRGSGCLYALPKLETPCEIKALTVDLVDLLSLSPVIFIHDWVVLHLSSFITKWKRHWRCIKFVVIKFRVLVAHDWG